MISFTKMQKTEELMAMDMLDQEKFYLVSEYITENDIHYLDGYNKDNCETENIAAYIDEEFLSATEQNDVLTINTVFMEVSDMNMIKYNVTYTFHKGEDGNYFIYKTNSVKQSD